MDEKTVQEMIAKALEEHAKSIEDLMEPTVNKLAETVRGYLSNYDSRLEELSASRTPKTEADQPATAMDNRVSLLEKELNDYKAREEKANQEARQRRLDDSLGAELDRYSPKFRSEALNLLKGQLGEAEETADGFVTKDGKRLSELTDGFFSSDFGRHLLPSQQKTGAGTEPSAKVPQSQQPSVADILSQAFM